MAPGKLSSVIPGCSGTRNLSDNLSDLKAQVAANQRGITLVQELIGVCGRRWCRWVLAGERWGCAAGGGAGGCGGQAGKEGA
jgi:hypothetical protein